MLEEESEMKSQDDQYNYDIFISHSSQSSDLASVLVEYLEQKYPELKEIRCWVAPRDLAPGSNWAEGIIEGIESSQLFLLLLCPKSNSSPQVIREVERAVNKGKKIIPVRTGNFPLSKSLEYFVSTHHWICVSNPVKPDELFSLATAVRKLLDLPYPPPPRLPPPPPPSKNLRVIIATLFLICIGGGTYFFLSSSQNNDWRHIMAAVQKADTALSLTTNKELFNPGDELQISCTPPHDGYLTIFSHTLGKDKVTILFPNKAKRDNKVSGGKAVNIPGANDDFKLRADHDTGKTTIVAYLHNSPGIYNPLADDLASSTSMFAEVEVAEVKRGFGVVVGHNSQTAGGSIELKVSN
jgi:hypothetical protein